LSKQIWLAPILNNNRGRLLARASDVLASGPSEQLLYLAASRPLLELAADRLLDGVRIRGVWGSLPVHLFRGLARYLLATAIDEQTGLPLALRIPIDQEDLPLKRSLISQIIKRLARQSKLKAIAPLAHREGCISTITTLIGEIQRAAKTPAEFNAIIEARASDFYPTDQTGGTSAATTDRQIPLQSDFDREVGAIYSEYASLLHRFGLTEDDADQLRALEVLRGETAGRRVTVPWLPTVRLLVIDGFVDFSPVQGEILRLLIPQVPEVVVNLNHDQRNGEIFRPLNRTIDQLRSIADFDVIESTECQAVNSGLSPLRERLFAMGAFLGDHTALPASPIAGASDPGTQGLGSPTIRMLDCSDRETELRAIAKEVKRLVLLEDYRPSDIAVVVRQRASYEDVITRVFDEEQIRSTLNRRIPLTEVPVVRAAIKLFELLIELERDGVSIRVSQVADLVKSGYFELSEDELAQLRDRFELDAHPLLEITGYRKGPDELNVGLWDADELENAVAYVGDDLRIQTWIRRAQKLTARQPALPEEKLADAEPNELGPDDDVSATSDQTFAVRKVRAGRVYEAVDVPLPGSERRSKPARDIHPALIAWSALVIDRLARILTETLREASPGEMRSEVMRLLDRLEFAYDVRSPQRGDLSDEEQRSLALDLRGLAGLRRALAAAARSVEISESAEMDAESLPRIRLAAFLEETIRCVKAQFLMLGGGDPDGLRVIEVTDIRGLRFRAVFIVGLTEGGFPLRISRDWIYPHEERERLKQYGLTLEDISPDILLKEEHNFYQAVCRATERLYLSRPLVMEDGSETVPSYYFEELARAVAPESISREAVRSDFDGQALFSASRPSELAMLVVRKQERRRHRAQRKHNFPADVINETLSAVCQLGYVSRSATERIAIERERGGFDFGRFDGVIGSDSLIDKLRDRYGLQHEFSASELSLYGKCPFKFFAEKVLRLEPRGEAALDLTALDAGSLLHEALRRFFESHRNQRLADLDRAALRRELDAAADAVFDEHERAVPPLNPQVWRIDREIRKLLLEQVLEYELTIQEQARLRDVRPAYFELAFGMPGGAVDPSSTDQRLKLQREAENRAESISVRGQIDRVDRARDGTLIAYDYKLSRGAGLEDMTEGRALQLHLYLSAIEQVLFPGIEIAGGGYYTIKGLIGRRNQGLYRVAMKDYTGVSGTTASSLSDEDWSKIRREMQARIWEFIDGLRSGRFIVAPSAPETTCPHCDFSAVCRYEKFRIKRKQGAWRIK